MANSVGPDQMPHSVASDQGLHCLLRPVCPNIKGYYGIIFFQYCTSNISILDLSVSRSLIGGGTFLPKSCGITV